jgi:hypothetical protein
MSAHERNSVRGYRPSRFGLPSDEDLEEEIRIRAANVEMYAKRVSAGLPIFAADGKTASPPNSPTIS